MGDHTSKGGVQEVVMATGQATESGCNMPARAGDFIRTAQAKAAIPEKEGHIRAETGQAMGKAGIGARTGEAIRGEIRYIYVIGGFYEKWNTQYF